MNEFSVNVYISYNLHQCVSVCDKLNKCSAA